MAPETPPPSAAQQADLAAEQAVVDAAYAHLERMRAKAERLAAEMRGTDPDLDWALARRARALAASPRPLCFGRTDSADGTTWYIGRRHVEGPDGDAVVVEWRAPVAVPFYRGNWSEPLGLERRRQFVVDGQKLLFIGDDTFGARSGSPPAGADEVRGREALMVELERARTGEMFDIVATIQPEQDEVIRAPVQGVLVVQGGPGSGKTAVGLHRAAFLLYTDDDLARSNVLVVGPSRTFLRYIAQVLPSLGEDAVVQTTLSDLVPEVTPSARAESADAQKLKGDARMAQVLARALALRRRPVPEDLEVTQGLRRLRVGAGTLNLALEDVSNRRVPYSTGRDQYRDVVARLLFERYCELAGLPPDGSQLGRALRATAGLKAAVDLRWPSVSPTTLVAEVLSKPGLLAQASEGVLSPEEQRLLLRRKGRAWTTADGPLVDEAKDLIQGQSRVYGYAVSDEAQDLSPMELRMLARRCPGGSMTLLGDIAQAVGPWGARSWEQVAEWLPTGRGLRVVELRHGYRSTSQVLQLASRLLPEAAPVVRPTEAVRRGRSEPRLRRVPAAELVAGVVCEAAELSATYPNVGLIVPSALAQPVLASARQSLSSVGEAGVDGLARPVTVVEAQLAKGLEFDAVVVAEPADVVAEGPDRPAGLRLLYVALTRPTQHLSIVHSADLPAPLLG